MNCKRCKKEIADGSLFCNWCGAKQSIAKRNRSNGEGSIYKRGSTWTIVLRSFVGDQVKRVSKGGFQTKKAAMEYLPNLKEALDTKLPDSIGFCKLWERFQETKRFIELSSGKKTAYSIAYKKCVPLYQFKDVRDIKYRDLQPIVDGLNFYPARDIKVLLGAMFELAKKMDWATQDPSRGIDLPKLEKSEKVIFSDEDIKKLSNFARSDIYGKYFMLGILCGFRPIELRSVTAEMIDFDKHMICGAGHKTDLGKEAPVMLSTEAENYAHALITEGIPSFSGDDAFYSAFYSTLEKAGIDNPNHRITPNSMRHTFVTRLTRAGVSPAILQKAARHTSYETTMQNYTHLPMEDVLMAVNKVSTLE